MTARPPRFILLLAALALGACDTSIQAFEETNRAYSVFGYLDANADTQFVRVEPLQDSAFAGSGPLDARVTTTNLATGQTVVWRDSVFDVTGGGVFVHNFYTTADFEPEATYRFRAERRSDGAASTAEVTLAPAFPPVEVVQGPYNGDGERTPVILRVESVERFGGIVAEYFYEACVPTGLKPACFDRRTAVSHLADTISLGGGAFQVEINWAADIPNDPQASLAEVYSFRITVASVSEDWPAYPLPVDSLASAPLPPPGINSNIEDGTGFLGGAFTRTVSIVPPEE